MRIFDCGFKKSIRNPKSQIRNDYNRDLAGLTRQ